MPVPFQCVLHHVLVDSLSLLSFIICLFSLMCYIDFVVTIAIQLWLYIDVIGKKSIVGRRDHKLKTFLAFLGVFTVKGNHFVCMMLRKPISSPQCKCSCTSTIYDMTDCIVYPWGGMQCTQIGVWLEHYARTNALHTDGICIVSALNRLLWMFANGWKVSCNVYNVQCMFVMSNLDIYYDDLCFTCHIIDDDSCFTCHVISLWVFESEGVVSKAIL
jgi:hypothetical protein